MISQSKSKPENDRANADISPPEKADIAVSETLAPYQSTPLIAALSVFSKLGDQPPMRVISGLVFTSGLLSRNDRLKRAGLRMLTAHTLATLAKDFIKHRIDRTRPDAMAQEEDYKMEPGNSEDEEENSFPSGHSAGAVAVGRAFGREFPEYAVASRTAAGLIAFGQITRRKHFPTDVIAGCALGFLSEWAAAKLIRPVDQDG